MKKIYILLFYLLSQFPIYPSAQQLDQQTVAAKKSDTRRAIGYGVASTIVPVLWWLRSTMYGVYNDHKSRLQEYENTFVMWHGHPLDSTNSNLKHGDDILLFQDIVNQNSRAIIVINILAISSLALPALSVYYLRKLNLISWYKINGF